ncbi:MAG TPA: protein phosphatase 2C domain-containing protein [Candidatus Paceibacterota bacterium]
MKLTADAHFLIGHDHFTSGKPCQDYALSGVVGNSVFAMVSDGCSTGGQTDVGARTIALTSAKAIRGCSELGTPFGAPQVGLIRRDGIRQASIILGLTARDMLATCIYGFVSPTGGFIHIDGDGVAAIVHVNGDLSVYRFDWADNTPFYPIYLEHPQDFIVGHGGDPAALRLTKEHWHAPRGKTLEKVSRTEISVADGMRGVTISLSEAELNQSHYIAIFTDGVTQVDGIEWRDVIMSLTTFKTSEGEFAKRRLNRMIKDAARDGRKGPLDDISYAVIKLSHNKGETHVEY